LFLLYLRLGKSRNFNIEDPLEYEEKSFRRNLVALNRFKPLDIQIDMGVPNGRSVFENLAN